METPNPLNFCAFNSVNVDTTESLLRVFKKLCSLGAGKDAAGHEGYTVPKPLFEELIALLSETLNAPPQVLGGSTTNPLPMPSTIFFSQSTSTANAASLLSSIANYPPESNAVLMNDSICDEPLRISNYDIINRIGTGSQGRVYRATSRNDCDRGTQFAIKVVPTVRQHIGINELDVWRRLHHPNVSPLIEAIHDRENQCTCLVTPLYEPGLLKVADDGSATEIPMEDLKSFFLGIARGMKYLHAKRIAHWDLKPENVLFDNQTKQAMLIDFGVSEDMRKAVNSVRKPWSRGTPQYWPPEMFEEVSRPIDGRAADVWSFGVMLYTAAVGHLPINASSMFELSQSMRAPKIEIPAHLPLPLRTLLTRILCNESERRPTFQHICESEFFSGKAAGMIPLPPTVASPTGEVRHQGLTSVRFKRLSTTELTRVASPCLSSGSFHSSGSGSRVPSFRGIPSPVKLPVA